jgi:hypothetical protein
MANKCNNCKHYKKIDDEKGRCRKYPPTQLISSNGADRVAGTKDYSIVEKTDLCGEYVAET